MKRLVNGIETTLVRQSTGKEINEGDCVGNFKVLSGTPPHKAASSGRVYVADIADPEVKNEFYPSVIDAEWTPHPWR